MKLFKTLLLTAATLWTLTGCCWTDHSETIKEVAEPMLVELKAFYQKNHRHPNEEERNIMFEKAGCKIYGKTCSYKKRDLEIIIWDTSYDYAIRLDFENTGCFFAVTNAGNVTNVNCGNSACIKFGQ